MKTRILQNLRAILADSDIYENIYQSRTTSATLDVHITHNNAEREANIRVGKVLADNGYSGKLLSVKPNRKNPDYERHDGIIMEFKKIDGKWSVKNGIGNAMAKGPDVHHVVFEVVTYERKRIVSQLWEQFKRRTQLMEVWIIYDSQLYYLKRSTLQYDINMLPK